MISHSPASSPELPKLPEPTRIPTPLGYFEAFAAEDMREFATAHGLACYEAGRASHAAPTVPVDAVVGEPVAEEAEPDPYFGVQDEVALTRAVCVMDDVLTDIEGWEDQALANAVKDSRIDLCAMIEVIRMRADPSYVCGSKPIDGNYGSPLAASMASRAQPHAPAPQAADDAFAALRALTEAMLTRADNDYMLRQLDAAVKVMAKRGCEPPVPWPDADFFVSRCEASTAPSAAPHQGADVATRKKALQVAQGADALREAPITIEEAYREGYQDAKLSDGNHEDMDWIASYAHAAAHHQAPQQGEEQ